MNQKSIQKLGLVIVGLWVLTLGYVSGCQNQPTTLSTHDEVEIYVAVIRQIYERDDTYGGTLQPERVYILRMTDDSIGDPDAERAAAMRLSETTIENISLALADLPTEIIWVDSRQDVPPGPGAGQRGDGGVIMILGNIHAQIDGSVYVAGSIYIASMAAGGQTYLVKQVEGEWKVIGIIGHQWIS